MSPRARPAMQTRFTRKSHGLTLGCSLLMFAAGIVVLAQEPADNAGLPATLEAHTSEVSSAIFTPDGRILATASYDSTLKLWDARQGKSLRTLAGHQNLVLSLAASPDGTMLASGANDNTIRLWDVPADKPSSSWQGHSAKINDVVSRPDGLVAVSVGDDKVVRVWNRKTGKLLQSLEGHQAEVLRAAFRVDGNQWATADSAGVVTLWTPGKYLDEDPTVGRTLWTHPDAVSGVSFATNNQSMLTSGRDGTIKQWQLNTPPHRVLVARGPKPAANAAPTDPAAADEPKSPTVRGQLVAVARNNSAVVSGGPDGVVRVVNLADGVARELLDQPGPVRSVSISANSTMTATGSDSGSIKLWNLADGADRLQLLGHAGAVRGITFHPDNARLASAGEDGTVRLWRLPTPPQVLAGHTEPVGAVTVSPNGQFAVTGGLDNTIRLWNAATGAAVATGAGHLSSIRSAKFRADSTLFASGDATGVVRFWNGTNATAAGMLGGHTSPVTDIAWHPSGERFATTGADGTAKLWRFPLAPARSLAGHTEQVTAIVLSSDGKLAATVSADQTVRLFDVVAGNQVRQLAAQAGVLTAVDLSADNAIVAAANATGSIVFRKTADGADLLAVAGHDGPIRALDFDMTGERIASAGEDGTVRVWALPKPAMQLVGHTMPVQAAAVTADGKLIATASADNSIRLWKPEGGAATATLTGHEKPVHSVTFRGDMLEAASGDAVGMVRLWDVAKAAAGPIIGAHDGPVRTLAYHPEQTRFLTGSDDGTLKLWRLPIVPPISIAGHTDAVQAVAVSRDGKLIVTGGADGQVRVTRQDAEPVVLPDQPGAVRSIAFGREDSLITAGSTTGYVTAWTSADGTTAFQFQGHATEVTGIAVQPQVKAAKPEDAVAPLLATTSTDGSLRIWTLPVKPAPIESFSQQITNVVTSRDGKLLASSGLLSGRPAVVVRDLETGSIVNTLFGHAGPVRSMQFSGDGSKLITGSNDGTARVWDLTDAKFPELGRFTGHVAAVTAVTLSADGMTGISGAADKSLKTWSVSDGVELKSLAGHTGAIVGLAMLADGTVVSAGDTSVRVWTLATGQQARTFAAPAAVTAMSLSPDASQLVIAAANNSLTAHNPTNGQPLFQLPGHAAPVRSVSFSGDGKRIVSRSTDGEYRVWESTGRLREARVVVSGASTLAADANEKPPADVFHAATFANNIDTLILSDPAAMTGSLTLSLRHLIAPAATPLNSVAFLPDGTGIVTAGADKVVRLWNPADGKEVRPFAGHTDAVTSLAVTHDGSQVIAGSADKTVRVWKTADATEVATLAQSAAVRSVSLSADSSRLAVSCDDGLVRVWDMATSRSLQRFAGHEGSVGAVAIAADGSSVVSGGVDKTARVWNVAGERVVVAGEGSVKQAVFVGDGSRFAAVVGDMPLVRVWNQADDLVVDLAAGEMPLNSLAVHPSGSLLVAGGADKKVYQWQFDDAGKATAATEIETPAAIGSVAFAPRLTLPKPDVPAAYELLVGGSDNRVRVFEVGSHRLLEHFATASPANVIAPVAGTRKVVGVGAANAAAVMERSLLQIVDAHADGVNDLVYSPDGKRLLTGGNDGQIRIWDSATAAAVKTLAATTPVAAATAADAAAGEKPMNPAVTALSITADGQRLVSATNQGKVQIWDLASEGDAATKPVAEFGHPVSVKAAKVNADGSRLTTLAADNVVRVFDVEIGRELQRFESGLPAEQSLLGLAFAPDNETVLATGTDKLVHVWQVSTERFLEAHTGTSTAVTFVGDGSRFATTGNDGIVRLWALEAADNKPLVELKGAEGPLASLVATADGTLLSAGGADQNIYTWKLEDASLAATVKTPAAISRLSLAGEPLKLAVAGVDRSVRIYSPESGRLLEAVRVPLPKPPEPKAANETAVEDAAADEAFTPALAVALTPDGARIFVSAANEGRAYPLALMKVLTGHTIATAVAFTPDGTKLVSTGADKTVRMWNVVDGAPVRAWLGHDAEITCVDVFADGKTIATGSVDHKVRLWPVDLPAPAAASAPGELIKLEASAVFTHETAVRTVMPSANGTRVVVANDDGFVRVWDVATARELERFGGHNGPVSSAAFVSDNLRVVSGGVDSAVREWRTSATRILVAHESPIVGVTWLANGTQFVSAGEDGFVRLWDTNFNLVRTFGSPDAPKPVAAVPAATDNAEDKPAGPFSVGVISAMAVRRDMLQLTAAVRVTEGDLVTGKLLVWNVANGELLRSVDTPSPVVRVDYSADNLKLVTVGNDKTVRVLGATDGDLHQEIASVAEVQVAAFAPDSRSLMIAGVEQTLHTWRYVSPTAVRTLTGHGAGVYSVKFSPDGSQVVSCSLDGTIRIWNAATGQQLRSLSGHQGAVTSIDVSPDGALIVSGGIDSTVRLWDATGGRQLKQLASTEGAVYTVSFSRDGKSVAAAGADKRVYVFNAETGAVQASIEKHEDHVYRVAFSPTSNRLISCGYSGQLYVWNMAGVAPLFETDVCRVAQSAAYSPDGSKVVVSSADGQVHVVQLPEAAR